MQVHELTVLPYERAIRDYLATGDECTYWHALAALGFERDEIQLHVDNPRHRVRQGFV